MTTVFAFSQKSSGSGRTGPGLKRAACPELGLQINDPLITYMNFEATVAPILARFSVGFTVILCFHLYLGPYFDFL